MTRPVLAALLAAVLLGGWRESLLHPLEHRDAHGRFVHLHGADGGDARGENDPDDSNPSNRLGDSLAALAACAAQAPVLSADTRPDDRISSPPRRAPRLADAPPFLSHGPPRFA
jgi:hypothetical protein